MIITTSNKLKVRAIAIVSLAVVLFLLMLLADHPAAVERYYSEGVYPVICKILHPVFNLFPFSFGDVLYILVIGWLLFAVYRLIKLGFKKQFETSRAGYVLIKSSIGVEVAILAYFIFFGG